MISCYFAFVKNYVLKLNLQHFNILKFKMNKITNNCKTRINK